MASNIITTDNYLWTNEHNNVSKQILHRYHISNGLTTGWKDGLAGIQAMIREVRTRNERLRSYGGKWSLSDVAVCNDSMHDSKPLTFYGSIGAESISGRPLYSGDPKALNERLFYFQSGAQINQINNVFEARDLCLPTTGASNGQTIAGAVSTGTHGSALSVGAMQDYVRALHIVTSDTEHVFLQPSTNPIINSNFSDIFGAKLKTDDKLFNSALVSFGSFGIIHGIILEAISLFILKVYSIRVDYNKAESLFQYLANFNHAARGNLSAFLSSFGLPSDVDPHHLELIVNPYTSTQNAFLRVMYKLDYNTNLLTNDPPGTTTRVGDDILSLIRSATNLSSGLAPIVVDELFSKAVPLISGYCQTPKNIFGDTTPIKISGGTTSSELGFPIDKASNAIRIIINLARQNNFTGLLGIRFVKNSAATLAFTRFSPITCTVELPAINSENTHNFYLKVFNELDTARIPFTLHWGQEGDYSPKRLAAMYGDALKEWIDQRSIMLPDPLQRYMFTNDFLKRCGLSETPVLTGGAVIV